jgi:hypothetical protein
MLRARYVVMGQLTFVASRRDSYARSSLLRCGAASGRGGVFERLIDRPLVAGLQAILDGY